MRARPSTRATAVADRKRGMLPLPGSVLIALILLAAVFLAGFDLSTHRIPLDEIVGGGPPKDGIPAILEPKFESAEAATFLKPDDAVVGVVYDGVARAYPLSILNWHEAVNDDIGGRKVAVTYCPLTASAIVFDRQVNGRELTFGISGKLYQSNVLLYDHQTESLWSQLAEEAVTGDLASTPLAVLPSLVTTWRRWRAAHPRTFVLSIETGHARNYGQNPYSSYERSPEVMFRPKHVDSRLPVKEKVFGLKIGGLSKAYRLKDLAAAGRVIDELAGTAVRIEYEPETGAVRASRGSEPTPLAGVVAYWFAWSAFHRDTLVWDGRVEDL